MKEVTIKFETDFESNRTLPIHIGRILVGGHIVRLVFVEEGFLKLVIPQEALDDKSIIVLKPVPEGALLLGGLSAPPR